MSTPQLAFEGQKDKVEEDAVSMIVDINDVQYIDKEKDDSVNMQTPNNQK